MVNLTIDGQKVAVPAGTTILDAAARVGSTIPHLCYLRGINEIAACRVCLVEKVGMEKLITACNTEVEEGMEILTNSPRVREVRRVNVELILSDHDCKCVQCVKSGNCSLQKIANDLGIIEQPYQNIAEVNRWNTALPLIREASKCVKCMRCVQICEKIQSLGVWDCAMRWRIRTKLPWYRSHRPFGPPGVKESIFPGQKRLQASWSALCAGSALIISLIRPTQRI